MKPLTRLVLAGLSALVVGMSNSGCVNQDPVTGSPEARVDQLFRRWNRPDSPGAAVVVVQDGVVVCQRNYGCANLEQGIPITSATVFDAASVAKQFTGLAIAMLIDEGKLSLEDDIRKHLPGVPDFGHPITIQHLLHHTSGLRDWPIAMALSGTSWFDPFTNDKILQMVSHQRELNFVPGETSLYSNTGYNLLAAVVTRVTGQSFRAWTHANLFQPLGMQHTHFCDDPTAIIPQRAESYESAGQGGFRHLFSQLSAPGSSSLMITAPDMGKWLINLETARVGGRAALAAMRQRARLNSGTDFAYGFGLALDKYHDLEAEGHGGGWAGYRSAVLHIPARRFAVAVLANDANLNAEALASQVADSFLGYRPAPESGAPPVETPAKLPLAASTPQQYVGDYWSDELHVMYRVEIRDGKLMLRHGQRWLAEMIARSSDHFDTEVLPEIEVAVSLEFLRNPRSEVTGFNLSARRLRNLRFTRVSTARNLSEKL